MGSNLLLTCTEGYTVIQGYRRTCRATGGHTGLQEDMQGYRRTCRATGGHAGLQEDMQGYRRTCKA